VIQSLGMKMPGLLSFLPLQSCSSDGSTSHARICEAEEYFDER